MSFSFRNEPGFAKFMTVFGYFMVAVYLVLGIFLFVSKQYDYIPRNIKFVFAFFFIAYGVYRLAKMLSKNKDTE